MLGPFFLLTQLYNKCSFVYLFLLSSSIKWLTNPRKYDFNLSSFLYKGCEDRNRYIKKFRIKGSPRQRDSQVTAQWQGRCAVLLLPWFVNLYPALYVLFKRIFRIQSSPLRSLSKTEMPNLLTTVSGNQGYPKATHLVNNLRKTSYTQRKQSYYEQTILQSLAKIDGYSELCVKT